MEYFGFASGSSKTGPTFPYMPESVLNSYPNNLLEHPVVPTAVSFINSYIQTPDAQNMISVVQTWADTSLKLLEKPTVQALGIGLSATICVYGVWRIQKQYRNNIVMFEDSPNQFIDSAEPNLKESLVEGRQQIQGLLDADITNQNSDLTQRQLIHTCKKLNELRYHLNQLEGEKDMLAAEVSMRKKIVAQLQGEIHVERDKRRQAELRMEMMEWENTHLRRLRRDVAVKEGKIDMLEACIKEKDEIQDRLFQENVILPKSIAEARAKEYEILHTKVQKFEIEAAMKRNSEDPYKPTRHESITSNSDRIPLDGSTATMETANQTQRQAELGSSECNICSEWDKSPSSTGSAFLPMLYATNLIDKTKTLLASTNWSNSTDKHINQTIVKQLTCKRKRQMKDNFYREMAMEDKSQKATFSAVPGQQGSKDTGKSLDRSDRISPRYSPWSVHSTEDGVLDQLKSFFSGFSEFSESESGFTATDMKLQTPSSVWDLPLKDKAENCCQDDDGDDAYCPSISDDQSSSVFMSASCGSASSDDDTRDVSQSFNNRHTRRHSAKRKASPEKLKSKNRNSSRVKNEPPTLGLRKEKGESPDNELRVPHTNSKNKLGKQISFVNEKKPVSVINPTTDQIGAKVQRQKRHQSRQKSRVRKSRSNSNILDDTVSEKIPEELKPQTTKPKESCKENPVAVIPLHGQRDKIDRDIYKQLLHCRRPPIPGSGREAVIVGDANKNSTYITDTDSEESWIVIKPPT